MLNLRNPFLRRMIPLAFLAGLVTLGARTCKSESASAEIWFDLGDAAPEIRSIRADMYPPEGGDGIAYFEAAAPRTASIGPWRITGAPGTFAVEVEVRTERGRHTMRRSIEIRDRARVNIDLSGDLRPR